MFVGVDGRRREKRENSLARTQIRSGHNSLTTQSRAVQRRDHQNAWARELQIDTVQISHQPKNQRPWAQRP